MSSKLPLLPAGTPVQIEVETVDQKFNSFIVGVLPDEFLILKTPVSSHIFSARTNLFVGNNVITRFLMKGTVFGFKSKLVEIISRPTKLIFIQYPSDTVQHALRDKKRVECNLPLKAVIEGTEYTGVILDISDQGCKFCISPPSVPSSFNFVTGDIRVRFFLPGIEKELEILGTQKHASNDVQKIYIGMKFDVVSGGITENISRYLGSFEDVMDAG
jgi:hypothetical protein